MSSDSEVWALVIASDAHTLVIVTDFLKDLNIHYKRNTTGVNVPQQAQAMHPPPALILLDLDLTESDPFAILQSLQTEPELSSIPVLAISEHNHPQASAHIAAFLPKPLPYQRFIRVVESLLNLPPSSNP